MPSKPLLGMPVVVGMSDAVMAMRSVLSAVAGWDDSSAVSSAIVQEALRMGMIYLRPTTRKCAVAGDRSKYQASHFSLLNKNSAPRINPQRTVIDPRERNAATPCCPRKHAKGAIMKIATLGLATALALTGTCALAQSSGGSTGGSSASGGAAAGGMTTGSPASGTTTGNATGGTAGTGINAGSAAAGQNSTVNPSGNSLINPSPSGSTLTPTAPGAAPRR